MPRVAVAGAKGFVGRALLPELARSLEVVAITRGDSPTESASNVEWRKADIFSLLQIEKALVGADYAIYLVHSMLPSAELNQGSFRDFDALAADNFARAAKLCGVRHIVYLGGIIPRQETLSEHLASREEVESILASTRIPLTVLRAGMILGPGGSSMTIMRRLVEKLPILVCPIWTEKRSQPILLRDVIDSIISVLGKEEHYRQKYDLAGPTVITYRGMMELVARVEGLKRIFIPVPFLSPRLSCLWVQLFTGAPKDLIQPLIESLRHEMLPAPEALLRIPNKTYIGPEEALRISLVDRPEQGKEPRAFAVPHDERRLKTVRSIQRMSNPSRLGVYEVAELYMSWLPKRLSPFLRVDRIDEKLIFHLRGSSHVFLILEYSAERSSPTRALFYLRGGSLNRRGSNGRLEFRCVPGTDLILTAVLDFEPRLPWSIYRYTQALIHLWVMNRFRSFLQTSEIAGH